MQLLQVIWEFLLFISMPWQAVIVLTLLLPLVPWLILRLLPWLIVQILRLVLILTQFIVEFLCFFEYKITQSIRKNKKKPPEILYILSDTLAKIVRLIQYLTLNAKHLSQTTFRITTPKVLYALPLVIIPLWFLRPYLGNSGFGMLIDNSATWWCSLEHWIMANEWIPSNLTCRSPNSSPQWDTFLKSREYKLKTEIREYTREISIQPNRPIFYYKRGNAYLELENDDAAFNDYTKSVKVDPKYAPGYTKIGDLYLLKGDRDRSFKEYNNAISADPKYAPSYVGRGNAYLAINETKSAFNDYTTSINLDSSYSLGYVGRGDVYIYQQEKDKEAALIEYKRAIQADPNSAIAHERMGNLYYNGTGC